MLWKSRGTVGLPSMPLHASHTDTNEEDGNGRGGMASTNEEDGNARGGMASSTMAGFFFRQASPDNNNVLDLHFKTRRRNVAGCELYRRRTKATCWLG